MFVCVCVLLIYNNSCTDRLSIACTTVTATVLQTLTKHGCTEQYHWLLNKNISYKQIVWVVSSQLKI